MVPPPASALTLHFWRCREYPGNEKQAKLRDGRIVPYDFAAPDIAKGELFLQGASHWERLGWGTIYTIGDTLQYPHVPWAIRQPKTAAAAGATR